ncbi:hypothetical protein BaRGS_00016291 [Batillaria attramentaria]|uniref:Uncharacterized protein n=1 Tax=Batillaria attramentaria TaxID=370345 RepID=A0ABD0KZ31_9CAEN
MAGKGGVKHTCVLPDQWSIIMRKIGHIEACVSASRMTHNVRSRSVSEDDSFRGLFRSLLHNNYSLWTGADQPQYASLPEEDAK